MNSFNIGSAVVALLTPKSIYVGADSLVKDVNKGIGQKMQKIRGLQGSNYYFATTGFSWIQNNIDLLYDAFGQSFSALSGGTKEDRIKRFEGLLLEHGKALLKQYPEGTIGEAIKIDFRQHSIDTFIFGADQEKIYFWWHRLNFICENEDLIPVVTRKGESETEEDFFQWAFIGHVDKISEIITSESDTLVRKGPMMAVGYLLAKQTLHSPDTVGAPYQIMELMNDGVMECFSPTFEQISLD